MEKNGMQFCNTKLNELISNFVIEIGQHTYDDLRRYLKFNRSWL